MFSEIAEVIKGRFVDSPLGNAAETRLFDNNVLVYDAPLSDAPRESILPRENGEWKGEPGDSLWSPNPDYIPMKQNPDGLTWADVLNKYGVDGIPFKNGEPDFTEVNQGDVEIDDFTDNRQKNFTQADIKLAENRGCQPEDIKQWRQENGYTWHECKDMKTMELIPQDIHNNIPHSGGIETVKRIMARGEAAA